MAWWQGTLSRVSCKGADGKNPLLPALTEAQCMLPLVASTSPWALQNHHGELHEATHLCPLHVGVTEGTGWDDGQGDGQANLLPWLLGHQASTSNN